jgi:transposase
MGRITMRKFSEILRQRYELKLKIREIAASLNVSAGSVSRYLQRAKVAGISWPLPEGLTEEELQHQLFLPVAERAQNRPLPDWEWVNREVRKKGMTVLLLWREYREAQPNGLCYSQFCHHYHQYKKSITPVMRQVHKAGEKSFVDYAGMKMPWLDVKTGEIHEAEIFVGCLGASQLTFVEATRSQQLPDWIQSHINMFEYFGGVSEIIVPDNLKSGVSKAHRYDPDINVNYQHLGEHYGIAIVPARAAEPKDKAKVENAVGCVERQILAPLRHHTFTSLVEMNIAIQKRMNDFNNQSFQKMKTSRRELFETIDKPALKPLPPYRYQYAEWKKAKVNVDYHIVLDDNYYSVPFKYIHAQIELRITGKTIECFFKSQRIAVHARTYKKYQHSTLADHMPPAHRAHAEWTPDRMRRWAGKIGHHTTEYIDRMMSSRAFPQQAYRACLGLLRLGSRYGDERLEKACAKALSIGASRYQQVESILKNRMEDVPIKESESAQLSLHDNIRGPEYYQ